MPGDEPGRADRRPHRHRVMRERDHREIGDRQDRGQDLAALQRARAVDEHHVVIPQLAQPRERARVHLVTEIEPRITHPAGHLRRRALRIDVDHQGTAISVGGHRRQRQCQGRLPDPAFLIRERHHPRARDPGLDDRRRGRGIRCRHAFQPFLAGPAGQGHTSVRDPQTTEVPKYRTHAVRK